MTLSGWALEEVAWFVLPGLKVGKEPSAPSRPARLRQGGRGGQGLAAQGWSGADPVIIVLDARDAACLALAASLQHQFPTLCHFVDFCDDDQVEVLLSKHPEVPREEVCRRGGVSAVLPEGVYFSRCEEHHKMLFYELSYRKCSMAPAEDFLQSFEREFMAPLRLMRSQGRASEGKAAAAGAANEGAAAAAAEPWWRRKEALQLVARSLSRHKFALFDGFLQESEAAALADTAASAWQRQRMVRGSRLSGLATGDEDGDVRNKEQRQRLWTVRGDHSVHLTEEDAEAIGIPELIRALDLLVTELKALDIATDDFPRSPEEADVAQRLRHTDFREDCMVAIYPGENRSRYHPHIDNDRSFIHRTLTAILYLNKDWRPKDGGELRLFHQATLPLPQPTDLGVKFDVVPERNRLLLFWANEECPHEVLPTFRDRYAVTTWFVDGKRSMDDPQAAVRLATHLRAVKPLTLDQAFQRSASSKAQLEHLRALRGAAERLQAGDEPDPDLVLTDALKALPPHEEGGVLSMAASGAVFAALAGAKCAKCGAESQGCATFCVPCWQRWAGGAGWDGTAGSNHPEVRDFEDVA